MLVAARRERRSCAQRGLSDKAHASGAFSYGHGWPYAARRFITSTSSSDGKGIFKLERTDACRAYPSPPSASGFSK